MEKSIAFYTKILGLPLRSKSGNWSEVGGQENDVYLGLHLTSKELLVDDVQKDTPSITFEVDDIDRVQQKLKEKGVRFIRDATEIAPGEWVATFLDPDNNKIAIHSSKNLE